MTAADQLQEERALRADAQRNLSRILEAARDVFAEQGVDASIADVAARAGVGTATIFRRFPHKDDLLAAILEERAAEFAARARQAAEGKDPARALRQLMESAVAGYLNDRCFAETAGTALFEQPRLRALVDEVDASIELLLRRAREAGAVRDDVTASDVSVLLYAVAQAGRKLEPIAPGAWHRHLEIVLDGLRPEAARPLSRKPLTLRQIKLGRGDRPSR